MPLHISAELTMLMFNGSVFMPSMLTLVGIPGLKSVQCWIGIPFCVMYIIALIGNSLILVIIKSEKSLHIPMYIFLAILAVTDIALSTCILPKMLGIFWFHMPQISFDTCLLQMELIHSFQATESGILLAMALDRYVAICNPLRHATIFSTQLTTYLGAGALIRAFILVSPSILLIKCRLKYYRTTIVSHSYCEHMAIVKLAAEDVRINKVCGLLVAFAILGFDIVFITFSYVRIFITVFQLPQKEARLKAFNTCIAHICVFLQFYLLGFFSFFTHRFWLCQCRPHKRITVELDCALKVSPMATSNSSSIMSSTFYLTGIPGYEEFHHWISIPFCLFYIVGITGNCMILHIVRTDPRLHEPMYYFLAMLSLTDMAMSLPTMISLFRVLWSISQEIQFNICVGQMFLIHTFSFTESSVLLAMALDRYVAICHPLRYAIILTPKLIVKIGIAALLRSSILIIPLMARLAFFPFCRSHVLSHSYCLHQDIIRLACADIRFNVIYGLVLITLLWGLDSLGIFVSYVFILHSVLRIASREGRLKALNTCASHICAVLILYVPMIGLSIVHRFAKHSSPLIHIFMAHIYLLVPPVLNPIIYSVKTKQIRQGIIHLICSPKISSITM
ncbi:olfactory receptor 630 [Cricetulus griseus]